MSAKRGLGAQPQEKLPLIHIRHVRECKAGFGGRSPREKLPSHSYSACARVQSGIWGAQPPRKTPFLFIFDRIFLSIKNSEANNETANNHSFRS